MITDFLKPRTLTVEVGEGSHVQAPPHNGNGATLATTPVTADGGNGPNKRMRTEPAAGGAPMDLSHPWPMASSASAHIEPPSPMHMAALDESAATPTEPTPDEEKDPVAVDNAAEVSTIRQLSPCRLGYVMDEVHLLQNESFPAARNSDLLDLSRPGVARWCRVVWEDPDDLPTYTSGVVDGLMDIQLDIAAGVSNVGRFQSVFVGKHEAPDVFLSWLVDAGYTSSSVKERALKALADAEALWDMQPMHGDIVRVKRTYVGEHAAYLAGRTLRVVAGMHSSRDVFSDTLSVHRGTTQVGVVDSLDPEEALVVQQMRANSLEIVIRGPEHHKKRLGLYLAVCQARSVFPQDEAGRVFRWVRKIKVLSHCPGPTTPDHPYLYPFEFGISPEPFCFVGDSVAISNSVHLTPAFTQTLAEPLGTFEACLPLTAATNVEELASSITGAYRVCSTTPLSEPTPAGGAITLRELPHFTSTRPLALRDRLRGLLDLKSLDDAAKRAAMVLLDLLLQPSRFALTLTPLADDDHGSAGHGSVGHGSASHGSTSHGSGDHSSGGHGSLSSLLRVRVHVWLRPLAFQPLREYAAFTRLASVSHPAPLTC